MSRRRVFLSVIFLVTMISLFYVVRQYATLEVLVAQEVWLRDQMARHPITALAVAFLGYVAVSLIPGLPGKSLVVGWLLGFLPGLLVVNVGLTIAAVIMFLLSRYLVRDAVYSRLGWFIERLNRGLRAGQGGYLLILRLLHAPFTLTNYAVGTTNVGVRQFWWTTQLGLLPGNIAFVLAGASLPSLRELAQQGPWAFVNMPLLIGLTLIGLLPIVIRWGIKRWGLAPGPAN